MCEFWDVMRKRIGALTAALMAACGASPPKDQATEVAEADQPLCLADRRDPMPLGERCEVQFEQRAPDGTSTGTIVLDINGERVRVLEATRDDDFDLVRPDFFPRPSHLTDQRTYDRAGRLVSMTTSEHTYDACYDADGRVAAVRTTWTSTLGNSEAQCDYTYDATGRPARLTLRTQSDGHEHWHTSSYRFLYLVGDEALYLDADEARDSESPAGRHKWSAFRFDKDGRWIETEGQGNSVRYERDSSGWLLFDGRIRFERDSIGRLVRMTNDEDIVVGEYSYDAHGRPTKAVMTFRWQNYNWEHTIDSRGHSDSPTWWWASATTTFSYAGCDALPPEGAAAIVDQRLQPSTALTHCSPQEELAPAPDSVTPTVQRP